jgi:hypothetical protein
MRNSIKFLGALAVAGLVAAGGSAFTGAGLTSSAPADQFIGGSVSQTVSGAILTSTKYSLTGNNITGIDLTFDRAAFNKHLVVMLGTTEYTCALGIAYVGDAPVASPDPPYTVPPDERTTAAACVASPGVVNTAAGPLSVRVTQAAETP